MIDITPLVSALITVILGLISTFLIPYIRNKLGTEKFTQASLWVKIAVEAAEQIYIGSGRGEEKKAYVESFLSSKGFKLDTASIDTLIEAAVLELNKV